MTYAIGDMLRYFHPKFSSITGYYIVINIEAYVDFCNHYGFERQQHSFSDRKVYVLYNLETECIEYDFVDSDKNIGSDVYAHLLKI